MAKKTRGNAKWKVAGSAAYKLRAENNRKRRMERHCKNFPNDKQAAEALAACVKAGKFNVRGGKKRSSNVIISTIEQRQQQYERNKMFGRTTDRIRRYEQAIARDKRIQRALSFLNRKSGKEYTDAMTKVLGLKVQQETGYAG